MAQSSPGALQWAPKKPPSPFSVLIFSPSSSSSTTCSPKVFQTNSGNTWSDSLLSSNPTFGHKTAKASKTTPRLPQYDRRGLRYAQDAFNTAPKRPKKTRSRLREPHQHGPRRCQTGHERHKTIKEASKKRIKGPATLTRGPKRAQRRPQMASKIIPRWPNRAQECLKRL